MSVLVWFRDKLFGKKEQAPVVAPTPVEPQITDAVTTEKVLESKPKRPRSNTKKVAKKTPARKKKS